MKLVGLILVGLCIGFVSGTYFGTEWNHYSDFLRYDDDGSMKYCTLIYSHYYLRYPEKFPSNIRDNPFELCFIPIDVLTPILKNIKKEEKSKRVSKQTPSTTESANTTVLFPTEVSSEIRNSKLSNSFSSKKKETTAQDTNPGVLDNFSTKTSTFLKTNTNTDLEISEDFSSTEASNVLGLIAEIANPKTSSESSVEESKETDGTIEITSPDVSDDSSSTQESNATKKCTEITNTKFSDNFSKEMYETTDEINETTNSTAPDVDTSDETSGVEYSTIPDKKQQTESSSKLTDRISDVKYSSSPSTPVTTISKVTSDETTDVSDSLETSSVTAGTSESTNSEISESTISSETSTETQTTSDEHHSTTPKSTAFISTDYSTSEETITDIEGRSSRTTVSSSTVRPNIPSTTRLYSTDRATTATTSPRPQETTLGDAETTHAITTIELPGTRTLKLAVSITFLAIAVIALVVLAVYFIATRRRTVTYDELILLS